jgi:hypothetical protein
VRNDNAEENVSTRLHLGQLERLVGVRGRKGVRTEQHLPRIGPLR